MTLPQRARTTRILLLLAPALFLSCNLTYPTLSSRFRPAKAVADIPAVDVTAKTAAPAAASNPVFPVEITPTPFATLASLPAQDSIPGEPAGCLSLGAEQKITSVLESLAQASDLLSLDTPLDQRIMKESWNAYTQTYYPYSGNVLSLDVGKIQNKYVIQKIINALHVAGFITWLRSTPNQGLHILAIPLRGVNPAASVWAPYIQAYWENSQSLPDGDSSIIPTLKLPPCGWMVDQGYAPREAMDWWAADTAGWPDYTGAAAIYLAGSEEAARKIAEQIGWLGDGLEGPNTMCGPLAWSILHDAGALPLEWGAWSEGPKSFWLARPRSNGRPWSLFSPGTYQVYSFKDPLGTFDFSQFPLYPGDFLYTYSHKDGFDHMLVVTEVDSAGNVYTVTNKVQVVPEKKMSIERLLLLNLSDPSVGIARNEWAKDGQNGRTGHDGFDVFRWDWMEKDIQGRPASYQVQPGDTLRWIALRWHTPVEQIARYNGITLDAALQIGQELQIPPNDISGVR